MSHTILGLLTETSLHAGIGQTVGVIDLPIQREAHTGWPFVYASSVKGSMRTLAEAKWEEKLVADIFGPEMNHGESNQWAGALSVGDARLLLLPVRSLTSHFKWVTCPALLRRFQADCRRLQMSEKFAIPPVPEKETALVSTQHDIDFGLFLEEFRFTPKSDKQLDEVIKAIAPLMGREDAETALQKQLVMVNDDIFRHIADYATPVNAHIKINNETKASENLWYEETLPSDTLLYVTLVAQRYKEDHEKDATKVIGKIQNLFFDADAHPYLQLGGNETVGMGWCKVSNFKP